MTRPMPGPPGGFTDRARLNYALLGKQITYEQYQEFGDALTRAFTARPKRLTDAECAAEYWRAVANLLAAPPHSSEMLSAREKKRVCANFATRPHALEES